MLMNHCITVKLIYLDDAVNFLIKYGCLSLKATDAFIAYEKLSWKQKFWHVILFPTYISKACKLPKRMAQ